MAAPGVTDLHELIRSMTPTLDPVKYVFVDFNTKTLSAAMLADAADGAAVQMLFRENEGWTGVVQQGFAEDRQLTSMFPCRRITLNVYSSLDAVGFLAAITRELAKLKIGVNAVSATLHDHLFVPEGTEEAVLGALKRMAGTGNGEN